MLRNMSTEKLDNALPNNKCLRRNYKGNYQLIWE